MGEDPPCHGALRNQPLGDAIAGWKTNQSRGYCKPPRVVLVNRLFDIFSMVLFFGQRTARSRGHRRGGGEERVFRIPMKHQDLGPDGFARLAPGAADPSLLAESVRVNQVLR